MPLLALRRAAWKKQAGDTWTEVATVEDAVTALGEAPRRVFLTLGRKELAPFAAAPQHVYLVRSVDPVDPPLAVPQASYSRRAGLSPRKRTAPCSRPIASRSSSPRTAAATATYAKIAAARALGIPVIMLARPALPEVATAATVEEVLAWLDHVSAPSTARGV